MVNETYVSYNIGHSVPRKIVDISLPENDAGADPPYGPDRILTGDTPPTFKFSRPEKDRRRRKAGFEMPVTIAPPS